MIIICINCDKKFEVNSELIPSEGRTIQCGSCNHIWFYKHNTNIKNDFNAPKNIEDSLKSKKIIKKKEINYNDKPIKSRYCGPLIGGTFFYFMWQKAPLTPYSILLK